MDIKPPSDFTEQSTDDVASASWVYIDQTMTEPQFLMLPTAETAVFAKKGDHKLSNEDSVLVYDLGKKGIVLAIADGVGGHSHGGEASKIAIETLRDILTTDSIFSTVRESIIRSFDEANRKILDTYEDAATTLIVAEILGSSVRFYFAGDSLALIASGRGRLKYRVYGHNPIDYGILAGVFNELTYDPFGMRHMVTNVVGSQDMQIQVGSFLELSPQDTIILGSDGLFDNLPTKEIASALGPRETSEVADKLALKVKQRMESEEPEYAKPDDVSFVIYRGKLVNSKK